MKSYFRSLVEELVRVIDDAPERLTRQQLAIDLLVCVLLLVLFSLGAYFVIFGLFSL